MLEQSQSLTTVQQIKLRKLELEIEALQEQVKSHCNLEVICSVEQDSNCLPHEPNSETIVNC